LEAASPALSDAASDPRRIRSELLSKYMGDFSYSISYMEFLKTAFPQDERYRTYLARQDCGRYLGEGQILPLGDNRDNSQDGRFFGPIQEKKVLGRGAFIHWPVKRIGIIK
jgi:signal peptidase I